MKSVGGSREPPDVETVSLKIKIKVSMSNKFASCGTGVWFCSNFFLFKIPNDMTVWKTEAIPIAVPITDIQMKQN